VAFAGAAQEAVVVADVVGKFGDEACRDDFPRPVRSGFAAFDDDCRTDIAEDEVTVAVAPFQMRRADFRVDDENRPGRTMSAAVWMAKVADEQATFMSKPKPLMPSDCCTSMAIAG
jgi:hypothetical protein